jgi:hypothetical protein
MQIHKSNETLVRLAEKLYSHSAKLAQWQLLLQLK